MIRVLVFNQGKSDFSLIENMLSVLSAQQTNQQYDLSWQDSFCVNYFDNRYFDIILIVQSSREKQNFNIIEKIIDLELPTPIIMIYEDYDVSWDNQAMKLGAADCIPLNELSGTLLDRTIRHAVGRKNTEAKLNFLATHDQLTGLANRYLFHEHLIHCISLAKRNHRTFALFYLDLDRFKVVNDSFGHDVGDMLLIEVANRIRQAVRVTDIVARIGGDEFTILIEETSHKNELLTLAEKIQLAIEPVITIHDHELYITVSVGIAYFPECGLEIQTLMKSADIALYKAKEFGRNKIQFFTNELNEQVRLKMELEKSLRKAMVKGEFEIYFQPQVSAYDQQVCGAEALLRWNHSTIGLVSPAEFIPLLEELGLMVRVEQWVIREVCKIAKRMTDKYGALRFAINISGSHFKLGNLNQNIYLALQESLLDASYLEIELTEDIMIEHVERNNNSLNELSDVGVSIALDDFGKGYSSLSYLKNFPANVLKIDKAFIDNILSNDKEAAIVEAMIDLSHKLGIEVVAEGVEEEAQWNFLKSKNCDFIQGFYFAKPMPVNEFDAYLSQHFFLNKKTSRL
jgi:diguanylate cyclase (GGDEF)-like protein